jgi:hypothetical protein
MSGAPIYSSCLCLCVEIMNTAQLLRTVESDDVLHSCCVGVFPCNRIPKNIDRNPACIIANTDPHTKPGQHWVAFYIEDRHCEFFDSYGRSPVNRHFAQFLRSFQVQYNETQVQAPFSSACGPHVLHYLFHRCRGDSTILECYTRDLAANDEDVCAFVNDLCDVSLPPVDHEFVYNQIAKALQEATLQ